MKSCVQFGERAARGEVTAPTFLCTVRSEIKEKMIQHTKPFFDFAEIERITTIIRSRNVNEGKESALLTATISNITGMKGGISVSTGTLGLHIALKALGIETEHDEVIIPDFACRSLFDCIKMAGGTPVFCDINLDDYSLDINSVRKALSSNSKAIILPHMYGCPADIDEFLKLGIPVIEDCAHSLGASYREHFVGSFGSFSVFSFEGSKLISAGEGGIVLAKEEHLLNSLMILRHGLNGHFAYHYRLSDLIAAVALTQIEKLNSMIERRRYIAQLYREKLECLERMGFIKLPRNFSDKKSVYYRFVVLCNFESANLIKFSNDRGILIRNPLPSGRLSNTFRDLKLHDNMNAERLAQNGISLPIYPDLTDEEIIKVVGIITSFCEERA